MNANRMGTPEEWMMMMMLGGCEDGVEAVQNGWPIRLAKSDFQCWQEGGLVAQATKEIPSAGPRRRKLYRIGCLIDAGVNPFSTTIASGRGTVATTLHHHHHSHHRLVGTDAPAGREASQLRVTVPIALRLRPAHLIVQFCRTLHSWSDEKGYTQWVLSLALSVIGLSLCGSGRWKLSL